MSRFCDGKRVSKSGNTLHTVKYLPERVRPKAAFCFHHGLGEHVGRYNTSKFFRHLWYWSASDHHSVSLFSLLVSSG